ncbi:MULTISPECIES: peptidase inhibitor family I36 protein [unclassified Streptomyces]|uniref:peptidase inhibitor family I36 protein n=1 Tax=unclassified Streptomyces TaxID=2593676 RepID=UPI0008DD07AB|nr:MULTISPECIES: peptidase inhibitor family I36 protein [unclassified Streptomyces]OII61873.1 hypothetical protein BJP39_10590 [Streptomyces sp. CC77]
MHKSIRWATGLLTAAAAVGAFAAPAHAETSWYNGGQRGVPTDCWKGYLCVWKDTDFQLGGWGVARFEHSNANWTKTPMAYMNDQGSSWYNNGHPGSFSSVRVYEHADYQGRSLCLDAGWGATWDSDMNDKGSSNRWFDGRC